MGALNQRAENDSHQMLELLKLCLRGARNLVSVGVHGRGVISPHHMPGTVGTGREDACGRAERSRVLVSWDVWRRHHNAYTQGL